MNNKELIEKAALIAKTLRLCETTESCDDSCPYWVKCSNSLNTLSMDAAAALDELALRLKQVTGTDLGDA